MWAVELGVVWASEVGQLIAVTGDDDATAAFRIARIATSAPTTAIRRAAHLSSVSIPSVTTDQPRVVVLYIGTLDRWG